MDSFLPPANAIAKPLHIQRVEKALNIGPFMKYAQNILTQTTIDDSDSQDSDKSESFPLIKKPYYGVSKKERLEDKRHLYNFANVSEDRKWLEALLLSDTETDSDISDQEKYIGEMLKNHVREKKCREKYYQNANNAQYGYYSAGVLSNNDLFPEHQQSIVGLKKRKRDSKKSIDKKQLPKGGKKGQMVRIKQEKDDSNLSEAGDIDWDDQILSIKEEDDDSRPQSPSNSGKGRRRKNFAKTPELMNARRRKMWQTMSKKEVGKFQRQKATNHKDMLTNCKKVAQMCQKVARQKAMESQKKMKETAWRAKRLTREMLAYWKRYDRVERETRRRLEKEAEEQRKMDVELIEVKRQQRKLNFLITQTELYAHFMSKKAGTVSQEEQQRILSQLDEEMNPRLAAIDDYDCELMKFKVKKNVRDALDTERARTREFDKIAQTPMLHPQIDESGSIVELPQPNDFKGVLKGYQLKGMTWLAHLYDQGISGILADEMGLGKTVQSIAFLSHVAENYGVWGPFLIISPASTLHNWQQEFQRFSPSFKVVPYWGSPNQRKILRQFWDQKDLHTREASFHVVITSYQLVVSDYKYFNRIKWQYMVLDEAQAIKSSSSVRWKLLLGFNCRNRLLLSGTPIQNSMAELWALLHFIMPTLFDSHDEFNEWFSKDIESHAENKTGIDEKQISRLHMILKPFMLRRIKKDVENELSDKIEIMTYCPLTTRQKFLYMALKKKIRIEDLLNFTGNNNEGHTTDKNFTSNLMNLVMQFRKVCNHPELFERRDIRSPFKFKIPEYVMPRLVYNETLSHKKLPSKKHLLYNRFSIWKAENIQRSLFPDNVIGSEYISSGFSFSRFVDLCPEELEKLTLGGLLMFLVHCIKVNCLQKIQNYRQKWWNSPDKRFLLLEPMNEQTLNKDFLEIDSVLRKFLFTSRNTRESTIYTHQDQLMCSMQETADHRVIRSRHAPRKMVEMVVKKEEFLSMSLLKSPLRSPTRVAKSPMKSPPIAGTREFPTEKVPKVELSYDLQLLDEFVHIPRPSRDLICEPTEMPRFVYELPPKIQCSAKRMYVESREAAWEAKRFEQCDSAQGWQLINSSIDLVRPFSGWSDVCIPDKQTLVSDAGKLAVLDSLLTRLKSQGHRVLIYSQMTKMIDLLEEYMWHRKHRYMRLDGSSKISARRDMVADFQNRADIFVFLLSTRAGGLGINLTAADTVIFYDSDWNPTVDQQAMDRAHRLGQTKQVTVYRLICKGTIEERILQRAREKSEIQRMVISGGNFKPDTLKPKEVVSLLLDDDEIEAKYRQKKVEDKKDVLEASISRAENPPPKRRRPQQASKPSDFKKQKTDGVLDASDYAFLGSGAPSPAFSEQSQGSKLASGSVGLNDDDDDSSNEALVVDCDSPAAPSTPSNYMYDGLKPPRRRHPPRGARRGRPRGMGRRGAGSGRSPFDGSEPGTPDTPKRGPGRPRSNKQQSGPANQGFRNIPAQKPRPYPESPAMSSMSYDNSN